MARITGLARSTIYHGLCDIRHNVSARPGRIRKEGGGRKKKASQDPTLLVDLKSLVEPVTRGDPMRPLLWTSRSLRNLAKGVGEATGTRFVLRLLAIFCTTMGYQLTGQQQDDAKAASTSIVTPNFNTSTHRLWCSWPRMSRSYRLTPKRRNWWAISRTTAGNRAPRAILNPSTFMISSIPS